MSSGNTYIKWIWVVIVILLLCLILPAMGECQKFTSKQQAHQSSEEYVQKEAPQETYIDWIKVGDGDACGESSFYYSIVRQMQNDDSYVYYFWAKSGSTLPNCALCSTYVYNLNVFVNGHVITSVGITVFEYDQFVKELTFNCALKNPTITITYEKYGE